MTTVRMPDAGRMRRIGLAALGLVATAVGVCLGLAAELGAASAASLPSVAQPVAYVVGVGAVAAAVLVPRRPVVAAVGTVAAVAVVHALGFPGGAVGLALFALCTALGLAGTRSAAITAALVPFAWAAALMVPPNPVPLASSALLGPAAGMLWTAATGFAIARVRRLPPTAPVQPASPLSLPALTPRETEVVALIATGLDNAAIAKCLFISPVTVKSHVSHALAKTGCHTRAQLVAAAYEAGITADR